MVKDDEYYLKKAINEIEIILEYADSLKKDINSKPIIDGIVFRMIQMSEHINYVSEDLKEKYSNVSWVNIKGFRNRLVHDYGNVNLNFVYNALDIDIPKLKIQLENILNDLS